MNRPDFYTWIDMHGLQKRIDKSLRNVGVKEHYEQMAAWFYKRGDHTSAMSCWNELKWYQFGKPYFKIWPKMSYMLGEVKIDIDGKFLHLPFPTYEIRLPKNVPFREYDGAPTLCALLVSEEPNDEKRPDRDWTLAVQYQFDVDLANDYMGWFFRMPIKSGLNIEGEIHKTYSGKSPKYEEGYTPSEAFCGAIVRLAISAAFFGVNQHEMILPDLPRKIETRYHNATREKNESEAKKMLDKAKRLGHFGWRIGSEIDLPSPLIRHVSKEQSEFSSYELQFGHIRRCHMRLQQYGKEGEEKRHELIFIPPTVVRPDLPMRDTRGFRIKDQ